MSKIFKLVIFLSFLLILSACGGGGGGGGGAAAGGGVGTGTVSMCTDSGTAFQTDEYNEGSAYLSEKSRRVDCAS